MKLIIATAMLAAVAAQTPAAFDLNQYLLLDSLSNRGHGGYGGYYGGHGGMSDMLPLMMMNGGVGGAGMSSMLPFMMMQGHGGRGGYGRGDNDMLPLLMMQGGGLAGNQGLTDYMMIDSIRDSRHYGRGGGLGGAMLPLMMSGGAGLSAGVQDYLVLDSFGGRGGSMGQMLPAMILGGQNPLGGTIGDSQVGQMWALNELGGGHGDFTDMLPLAAMSPAGTDINQLWGMQQLQHGGSHNPLAMMAATGQNIGTLGTPSLLALSGGFGGRHGGYGRRYGYAPRQHYGYAPRQHYGYAPGVAAAPVVAAPVVAAPASP